MRVTKGVEILELEAEGFGGRAVLHPTLIWDDKEAILIDTGMPGQYEKIISAMSGLGMSLDKLKAVILTHQDIDHIGSVPEIIQATKGRIQVFAHELDKPYIEGEIPLIKTNPRSMAKILESLPEDQYRKTLALCENPPKAKIDDTLSDGQEIPYCGGIKVLFTPGHTPGHISLYLKNSKTLVAADAMICVEGNLRGPVEQTTLDMDTALRSLEKFLEYDVEFVVCYHGGLCNMNAKGQIQDIIRKITNVIETD
ncbi:MBL fold metallo-hydrolase [Bacillus methanolicus]|uniref:MBL fold metallo-hydrolase n=1 Tax=Bacillus methanolicus TaxID=1471 RepID=UPI0023809F3E|nr:MBL fold metallo-hydrolase [Bacillus methanolicus]MDE3840656.1 MBL fold metallo-hydrolase [Bacillus methanolicus]